MDRLLAFPRDENVRAAERAAERVALRGAGSKSISAYSIAYIIQFKHPVAEGFVDQVLARVRPPLTESRDGTGRLLSSRFHRYADLARVKPEELRWGLDQLASRTMAVWSTDWLARPSLPGRARLACTFLRFAVGVTVRIGSQQDVEQPWPRSAVEIGNALSERLGLPCRCETVFDGSFYDSVYSGLVAYQAARLEEVALDAIARSPSSIARVDLSGFNSTASARLALLGAPRAPASKWLEVPCPPGNTALQSAERIRSGLSTGGLCHADVLGDPDADPVEVDGLVLQL